ncbi:MAG: YitT family protein [Lachnospiraceae bacterium]
MKSKISTLLWILAGTAILSFGMYNIHQQAAITEGGVLGTILLLNHWFQIPSSLASPILDGICYLLAFRFLGGRFLKLSLLSSLCLSGFFRLWEQFPPLLPDLSGHPLTAAILGGIFVGVGVGLVVRQGSSSGGDDALALTISKLTHWRLSRAYLITDITVLCLSLSYIPWQRIAFSLITVTISSLLVDFIKEGR